MQDSRVNERINAQRVVLITADGVNRGEMPKYNALQEARANGLDLVEVTPGRIPTCRIMDYGKLQYQRSKAERHQKHAPSPKEMRISYNISEHDLDIKLKKVKEFLEGGHRVTFFMKIKGRERYVGKTSAKDKFNDILKSMATFCKFSSVTENGDGYTTNLTPL